MANGCMLHIHFLRHLTYAAELPC